MKTTGYRAMQAKMFADDLAAMIALSDARKAEDATARDRMRNDPELRAALAGEASRRGVEVDWAEYFRNARVN